MKVIIELELDEAFTLKAGLSHLESYLKNQSMSFEMKSDFKILQESIEAQIEEQIEKNYGSKK